MPANDSTTVVIVKQETPVTVVKKLPPPVVHEIASELGLQQTVNPPPLVVISPCPTTGDLSYVFDQPTPSALWTIVHGLGKNPSVTVVDSANTVVYGQVVYIDTNSLTVRFKAAFSGKAYLN